MKLVRKINDKGVVMVNKTNSKYFNTAQLMDIALLALLEKKNLYILQ